MPAPGTVLAGPAQKDSSALVLERGGSEFEPDFAQRVAAENSSARYSPAWTSDAAGFGKLAYAIYSFNLQDYSGMQTLQLTWGEAPLDHANLWIGLSRWERDCWRWRRGPSSGLLDLGAAGYEQYIKPGTGELLIAVVMTGTAQALLDRLRVGGATRSDWWMFGHDTLHNRRSQAVGHGSSNLRWRFRTGAAVVSSPAFGADGAIYFGSDDGCVYALNPDCSVRWTFTAGGPVRSSPAVSLAGTVYVGCDDGILYAIGSDGSLLWAFETGAAIYASPALGSDGTVFVGSDDHFIYAVKPDGEQRWKYNTSKPVRSSPAIGAGNTVYIGSDNHFINALSFSGPTVRSYSLGSAVQSSPAIGPDGTVYAASEDGYLYAVKPDCSGYIWRYSTGTKFGVSSPALSADGIIYIGAEDGYIYAIDTDPTIGDPAQRLKWRYATGATVLSSPAVDRGGVIYVGGQDGSIYALNATGNPAGSLKWRYLTGAPLTSSPALSETGEIIVGCTDGFVYAIGADASCKPFSLVGGNPATVLVGEEVAFDASRSYDPDGQPPTLYEWDWTADGNYDQDTGTNPVAVFAYPTPGFKTCRVRVTDDEGDTGVGAAITEVQLADATGLSATDGTVVNAVDITWNPVLGANGYELEYKPAEPPDGLWLPLAAVAGNATTSFAHTTVSPPGAECQPGTVYTYHARAAYASFRSLNWSNEDTGVTWTGVCSGYVNTDGGLGTAGVTMNFSGGLAGVTTDANGYWARDGIPNGTYTVTPEMAGVAFEPASREFTIDGADLALDDFLWSPPNYSALGYVQNSAGTGMAGVHMSFSGGLASVNTDGNGLWTRSDIPSGTYTVTPHLSGYIFHPASRGFTLITGNANVDTFHGMQVPALESDTLYAIPTYITVAVGEPLRILVATGQPAHALQYMSSVGFTVESTGTYVPHSFNIGLPGGGRNTTDGYWALMGPPPPPDGYYMDSGDGSLPGDSTDIGGGRHRYNFAVVPLEVYDAPGSIGDGAVLCSFELSFSAPGVYHLGFQLNNGSVDQTYYVDGDGARHYWAALDGSHTVTVF